MHIVTVFTRSRYSEWNSFTWSVALAPPCSSSKPEVGCAAKLQVLLNQPLGLGAKNLSLDFVISEVDAPNRLCWGYEMARSARWRII
jgi:hypothetical protein